MTTEEISRIINPKFPWVYAPTTAPTKLLLKDAKIKVGYFQFTQKSTELEKSNKYTFVEFGEKAENYRATGDDSYITIVDGKDILNVEYPPYQSHDVSLEYIITQIDQLRSKLLHTPITIDILFRKVAQFRFDWNIDNASSETDEFTIGGTKQILLDELGNNSGLSSNKRKEILPSKSINIIKKLIEGNQLSEETILDLHKNIIGSDGKYRIHEATVHHRIPSDFSFSKPAKIKIEIQKLVSWYNDHIKDPDFHFLFLAAIFHYRLVSIHPFGDGNGRIARIISSAILSSSSLI